MAYITNQDIVDYLNPTGNTRRLLTTTIGAGVWAKVIARAEAVVKGYTPEDYSGWTERVSGLVLTREAEDGETTFTLPTAVQDASSAYVWVNHPKLWRDRKKADAFSVGAGITVTDTQVVLDEALSEGDVVVADVYHDGSNIPQLLKNYTIEVAACTFVLNEMKSLAFDDFHFQTYSDQLARVREDLIRLQNGKIRLDEWDSLDIIGANETAYSFGPGTIWPTGW